MSEQGDTITTGDISGSGIAIGRGASVINLPPEPLPTSPLHQLPSPPANFTGRDDELKTLRADLQNGVTISGVRGMGGVGKTALAVVLAHELKARYPDAQFFLDLRGPSDRPLSPADALAHVIRGYHPLAKLPEGEAELGALYRHALTGQRALLFFDNAREAAQVRPLIPPAGCFLLVTSRRQIELSGMRSLPLGVLQKVKAVELLLTLGVGDEGTSDGVTARIAELCGYLPLALRLAAGAFKRADAPTPEEYAERLADRRKRLRALDESAELTGENALTATLQESYAALTAEQQKRWRALSVFPADFDRTGAGAVWAAGKNSAEDEARETLSTLVSYSLLEYTAPQNRKNPPPSPSGRGAGGEGGRYRLHDLALDFAAQQLPDPERVEAQLRHAEHYKNVLSTANQLYLKGNENIVVGLALFDAERVNIEAGQRWAANPDLRGFENPEGLAQAAAQRRNEYPDVGAYVLDLRQHPFKRIEWLKDGLQAARQLQDRQRERHHLNNLGIAYNVLSDVHKAIEYFEQALTINREFNDRRYEGSALNNIGNSYSALGDANEAIEYYKSALSAFREADDRRGEANALMNIGNALVVLGDTRNAVENYEHALSRFRETGDRRSEGNALGNLGIGHAALGETRKAIKLYAKQLSIARDISDRRGEGNALINLGNFYSARGDARKAVEHHEHALAIFREIGDPRGEGNTLGNLGNAHAALGDIPKAVQFYEQQLAISRGTSDRRGESNALGNLGNAYAEPGDTHKAIEFYEQCLTLYRTLNDRRGEGRALGNLGNAHATIGNIETALELYKRAIEIRDAIGDQIGKGNDLWNMALVLYSYGERGRAIAHAEAALKIREAIEDPNTEKVRKQLAEWRGSSTDDKRING